MMRTLVTGLLVATLCLQGCAAVLSALPTVISWVTDAATILDQIDSFAGLFFSQHPDAETQRYVEVAIAKARASLNAALRATQGGQELSKEQLDKAFEDFRAAYAELLAVVGPIGVKQAGQARYGMSTNGTELVVPPPLAMLP